MSKRSGVATTELQVPSDTCSKCLELRSWSYTRGTGSLNHNLEKSTSDVQSAPRGSVNINLVATATDREMCMKMCSNICNAECYNQSIVATNCFTNRLWGVTLTSPVDELRSGHAVFGKGKKPTFPPIPKNIVNNKFWYRYPNDIL